MFFFRKPLYLVGAVGGAMLSAGLSGRLAWRTSTDDKLGALPLGFCAIGGFLMVSTHTLQLFCCCLLCCCCAGVWFAHGRWVYERARFVWFRAFVVELAARHVCDVWHRYYHWIDLVLCRCVSAIHLW